MCSRLYRGHFIKEIREKGKLEYAVVRVKYKGKEILFHVMFCGGSEDNTGTAGEPKILETVGLVRFDNSSFSKKVVLLWNMIKECQI